MYYTDSVCDNLPKWISSKEPFVWESDRYTVKTLILIHKKEPRHESFVKEFSYMGSTKCFSVSKMNQVIRFIQETHYTLCTVCCDSLERVSSKGLKSRPNMVVKLCISDSLKNNNNAMHNIHSLRICSTWASLSVIKSLH